MRASSEGPTATERLRRRFEAYLRLCRPVRRLSFNAPLVLLQSDDWGLAGLRDADSLERLRRAGVPIGESTWDRYGLETAGDVEALCAMLASHRDRAGNPPALVCNFVVTNVDFRRAEREGFRAIPLKPLVEGLPEPWERPGLIEAYLKGRDAGTLYPALHGLTHFCLPALEAALRSNGPRSDALKALFREGTPFLYPSTPWVGFEFRDDFGRWLDDAEQNAVVGRAAELFQKLFGSEPISACAPGYRADEATHRAWAARGLRVCQNGPGPLAPPFFDALGLLQLHRNLSFEPGMDPAHRDVEPFVERAARLAAAGLPVIVSTHSINYQSTLHGQRDAGLDSLDRLLRRLEQRLEGLLYVHDADLLEAAVTGGYRRGDRRFPLAAAAAWRPSPLLGHALAGRLGR